MAILTECEPASMKLYSRIAHGPSRAIRTMCRTCRVTPATAASANRLPKPICGEVEKSQTEICDFSRLKCRGPPGSARSFSMLSRTTSNRSRVANWSPLGHKDCNPICWPSESRFNLYSH